MKKKSQTKGATQLGPGMFSAFNVYFTAIMHEPHAVTRKYKKADGISSVFTCQITNYVTRDVLHLPLDTILVMLILYFIEVATR